MAFSRHKFLSPNTQKKLTKEKQFENLWTEFDHFYLQIVIENQKVIREAKKKYKSLLLAPQISSNLDKMNQMLKEEDQNNRQMKTIGECLEYLLRHKIIEVLCAYAMIDKPRGFFKLAISVLSEMFQNIQSTSILCQSSVHPGVNQLLRCIYRNIKSWKFKDNGQPDINSIEDQDPYILDCTYEILELLNSIANKVSDEPYLVKVFFSGQMDITNGESSERICLPFQILVLYFKMQSKLLSATERVILRSILLKCLNCMSKDQMFSDYISNESDFIDIFMQILASQLENLPSPLLHLPDEGFNIEEQLRIHYNAMIVDQFRAFIDACFFLKEILTKVFNENSNSNNQLDFFQDQKHEIQVKESFQISFFQLILCSIIQPALLDKDQINKARTLLQYLIEILVVLNDKSISRLVFAFFFNKMDSLRRQYENLNTLPGNQINRDSFPDNITDQMNYYQNDQLSQYEDENMIDYENNNKKKNSDLKVPILKFPDNGKQQSFDLSMLLKESKDSPSQSTQYSPRKSKQKSIYNKMEVIQDSSHEFLSHRSISGTSLQKNNQQQHFNDPMTMLRLQRIDVLLKEAEDVQDIKSDIDQGNHFNFKLNKSLKYYEGDRLLQTKLHNLQREQEGMNIVTLQMLFTIIQIEGVKQFFRDFIVDDIKVNMQDNSSVICLQEYVGQCSQTLTESDFLKITEIVEELTSNELDHLTKIQEYVVESHNDLLHNLFQHLENFFSNKPDENIILIDILLLLIDDSEPMLSDSDSFYFIVFLMQNHSDSILQRLENLKGSAITLESDEAISRAKKEILRVQEFADDEGHSPRQKKDPNTLLAENIIIFEGLYQQFSRFIVHHYLGFQIVQQYYKACSDDYSSSITNHFAIQDV